MLDHSGEVYSLPRMLDLKTKEVGARLGDGGDVASVEATKKIIGQRMSPAIRRHVEESRTQFRKDSAVLGRLKAEMTRERRDERINLDSHLKAEWESETRERASRLPTGLRGLWHRITGKYQETRAQNEAEAELTARRHAMARQALIERQLDQRGVLQAQFKDLRQRQAARLLDLRRDVGRFLSFTRGETHRAERSRDIGLGLRLER